MTPTPTWSAARAGLLGDAGATAASAQINQLLGTHAASVVYQGTAVVQPTGIGYLAWGLETSTQDVDQPFTMSGTSIGRVSLPLLAVGNGADLLVSLCADNGSGRPGTVVAQTRIPASWITQLSAVTGMPAPSSQYPTPEYTGSPLATAQFNGLNSGAPAQVAWPYPAPAGGGIATIPTSAYYGNYLIQVGGLSSNNTATAGTFTIACDATGIVSQAIPQPPLPTAADGSGAAIVALDASTGDPQLVMTGGATTFDGSPTSTVYIAPFDASTGAIGSWSQQAALPYTIQNHGIATANGYVYVAGGLSGAATTTAVTYGQVVNGQIAGWTSGPPLPKSVQYPFLAAVGDLLVVAGGASATFTPTSNCYYAAVDPTTGAIGNWQAGPPLPVADWALVTPVATPYGIVTGYLYSLGVTAAGPAGAWLPDYTTPGTFLGLVQAGSGQWMSYRLFSSFASPFYVYQTYSLTTQLSVPLPATGLTNGATYHLLLQQQGGDLSDYLTFSVSQSSALPGNPDALVSSPGAYSWNPYGLPPSESFAGCVPLTVYSNTVAGQPWHFWEDSGAKVTTLVWATTPDKRILGVCEATRMGLALNANTGFQSGVSPWTATNCTLAQSATQSYAGGMSGRITPNGTSPSVFISSERLACMPGQSVTASAWAWFTSSVSSAFSLSVTWYTAMTGGTTVSTSSALGSATAATWAEASNTFTAPAAAYAFTLVPTLSGTPSAAQIFYLDNVIATYTYTGTQQSTVTAYNWGGATWPNPAWPAGGAWPPLGTQVLS